MFNDVAKRDSVHCAYSGASAPSTKKNRVTYTVATFLQVDIRPVYARSILLGFESPLPRSIEQLKQLKAVSCKRSLRLLKAFLFNPPDISHLWSSKESAWPYTAIGKALLRRRKYIFSPPRLPIIINSGFSSTVIRFVHTGCGSARHRNASYSSVNVPIRQMPALYKSSPFLKRISLFAGEYSIPSQ